MSSPLAQATIFLIKTAANLYFLIVLLRLLLQFYRIGFYNPASQWVLLVTNPVIAPLQRIIPKHPKIDFAAFILLIILKALEFTTITLLGYGILPSLSSLIIWPIGESLSQIINFFFFAIVIAALLSWINPRNRSPLVDILSQITEPLLMPARKLIPPAAGLDFSPIIVLVALKLAEILFAHPITQIGMNLLYGV